MLFIFLGKSIAGTDDKPQTIKFNNLEFKANSVVGILTASLLTAVLPLILQFYIAVNYPPLSAKVDQKDTVSLEVVSGESRCISLKGPYKLFAEYEFVKLGNIKATVRNGTWDATTCNAGQDGFYILRGKDTSHHEIEVMIDGRWEHVATTITNYNSDVLIDKQGKLIKRTFQYVDGPARPKLFENVLENRGLGKYEDYINRKIDEYVKERDSKISVLKTKSCYPALFDNDGFTLLAFLCQDYTRAMGRHY